MRNTLAGLAVRGIRLLPHDQRWRLACFDLDGTLVRGTTGQHLAAKLGHAAAMSEVERNYAARVATNADVAAVDARHYRGLTSADVRAMLDDIPVLDDIAETVEWLKARGIPSVICTFAWKLVGEVFAERYGFVASSGPTLRIGPDGTFTGEVEADFTEYDKPAFVASMCDALGAGMPEVFHVGDSRSDIPLFEAVGYSVALNASQQAREAARVSVQADSLLAILKVIPGLESQPGAG